MGAGVGLGVLGTDVWPEVAMQVLDRASIEPRRVNIVNQKVRDLSGCRQRTGDEGYSKTTTSKP